MGWLKLLGVVCAVAAVSGAFAQDPGFTVGIYASGLSSPTCLAWSPDGRLYVGQKNGFVRVYQGSTFQTNFVTVQCDTNSERGLLGIAFDPNFTSNHYVYIYYTTNALSLNAPPTPKNRVSRFTELNQVALPGSETILLDNIASDAGNHNAGCLRFGADGKLWITAGDGGSHPANGQDLTNLNGKLLRINADGTIPNDNPFVGMGSARPEIWAYGFRNPFRFHFKPGTNVPFVADVGQNTWEEVNVGVPGGNFGWNTHEGTTNALGFVNPIYQYNHNGASAAIIGGGFVGDKWPLAWQNRYLFGDTSKAKIYWLSITPANTVQSAGTFMPFVTPVDFALGPDGAMYVVNYAQNYVHRIAYRPVPSSVVLPATVVGGNVAAGSVTLDVAAPAAGLSVALQSSSASIASVPASILVAPGSTTGSIPITTKGVLTSTPVTIQASVNGVSKSATISVEKAILTTLTMNPATVVGGLNGEGIVTLNGAAPASGRTVSLFSQNTSAAQVPVNVSIPAGARSAAFPITTHTVVNDTPLTITSTLGNDAAETTLTVLSAPVNVQSITVTPGQVPSGGAALGHVQLTRTAPTGGQVVTLSDDSPVVTTPATMTVGDGSTTGDFTVATRAVDSPLTVTVTATIGSSSKSTTFILLQCPISGLSVTPPTVAGGVVATGQVNLRNPAPAGGASVQLSDNSTAVNVPASVLVPGGGSSNTFWVSTAPVSTSLVATISATYNGISRSCSFTVSNAVALLSLGVSPNSVVGGSDTTGTVTLTKPAPAGGIVVAVADNRAEIATPGSVIVGAGLTSNSFGISTSAVSVTALGTVSASYSGVTKTVTLTLNP